MKRILYFYLLIFGLAHGAMELEYFGIISRQPDGLGPVLLQDLDGDGDEDFLITGRRNDYVGWKEGSANGEFGSLKWIDTGEFHTEGRKPLLLDFDHLGFPDIHYSGWRIPNLYRRYGKAEAFEPTEGCDLITGISDCVIGRERETGEWQVITGTGRTALQTPSGVLRTESTPDEKLVAYGDVNRDGKLDLLVALNHASLGDIQLSGFYLFRGAETGFDDPTLLTEKVPIYIIVAQLSSPNWIALRMFATEEIASDGDYKGQLVTRVYLANNPSGQTNKFFYETPALEEFPGQLTGIYYQDMTSAYEARISFRCRDRNDVNSVERVRIWGRRGDGIPIFKVELPLGEVGTGELFELKSRTAMITCFQSNLSEDIEGAECLMKYETSGLEDNPDSSQFLEGELLEGPFGELQQAQWIDLTGDGRDDFIGCPSRSNTLCILPDGGSTNMIKLRERLENFQEYILDDWDADGDPDFVFHTYRPANYVDEVGMSYLLREWENMGNGDFYSANSQTAGIAYPEIVESPRFIRKEHDEADSVIVSSKGRLFWYGLVGSYRSTRLIGYPGTNAEVILSSEDVDQNGVRDFLFYPSVFGNKIALGKMDASGTYLNSMEAIMEVPEDVSIPNLVPGDLEGNGSHDFYHAGLSFEQSRVIWLGCRIENGAISPLSYPDCLVPGSTIAVAAVDVDGDGDTDLLRFSSDTVTGPSTPDTVTTNVYWSEHEAGTWVNHEEILGQLRILSSEPNLVLTRSNLGNQQSRILVANRIGEVLQLDTRLTQEDSVVSEKIELDDLAKKIVLLTPSPIAGTTSKLESSQESTQILKFGVPVSLESSNIHARVEISEDLLEWRVIDVEPDFVQEDNEFFWYQVPLTLSSDVSRKFFARIGILNYD
ncbi:VCBS repeat-containing protein [Luteolibacter pohnpeiensis]|uniref:VCBS repeat-containing protein n=1 Tax=Luteolibacter pohnpeiensis TaxID=454153 RepID=A0A934VPL4_9BACT|nr:VCBS repeat-containing protein [Luteolibacter pohnpeiensis]MBK1881136.1 VCBS repeat-containing protein [Luteolibacter pohnpeiensis]